MFYTHTMMLSIIFKTGLYLFIYVNLFVYVNFSLL